MAPTSPDDRRHQYMGRMYMGRSRWIFSSFSVGFMESRDSKWQKHWLGLKGLNQQVTKYLWKFTLTQTTSHHYSTPPITTTYHFIKSLVIGTANCLAARQRPGELFLMTHIKWNMLLRPPLNYSFAPIGIFHLISRGMVLYLISAFSK
jgi:hypothetical protein